MATDDDAYALLQSILAPYGLPQSVAEGAWQQYLGTDGSAATLPEVLQWVRQQPEYKVRFPGIDELRAQGSPYGNEGNYAAYVQHAKEMANAYGMPPGVYDDPSDFVAMMKNNVSPQKLNERYQMAAAAVYTVPQEVRDALAQQYGVSSGGLVAYYLDPDRAAPVLERQFRAAQVTGAGKIAGVDIDRQESERLTDLGVSFEQAQQGFGQVTALRGLGSGLGAAETADEETRIGAILGQDQQAAAKTERVAKSRQAQFSGSGGPASTSTGVSGLGQSRTR